MHLVRELSYANMLFKQLRCRSRAYPLSSIFESVYMTAHCALTQLRLKWKKSFPESFVSLGLLKLPNTHALKYRN